MYSNILKDMGFNIGLVLPAQVFFKPNDKFFEEMSKINSPIIEMGAGTGYTIKKMQEYGEANNHGGMANCRGFDLCQREEYHAEMIHTADALDCPFYCEHFTVLVCRPNHSGWFSDLLEMFTSGQEKVKRLIYVGLPRNIPIDMTNEQLEMSVGGVSDVGEEGEIMITWEFN